jgi:dihydrofolate synthase/folylpolyglutamate synthase
VRKERSLTYVGAVERLGEALAFGVNPSLDGIRALVAALGSPEARFRSIQVTGTNGKTSVTRLIAAILRAHGASTGTYTSPHLVSYTERILIDGEPLGEELFARAVSAATEGADMLAACGAEALGLPPDAVAASVTEFELITAAALWAFAREDVEWAVLEVGMGGRWDATSVVLPEVAVITGVALDHTERLGATREAIAEDKAYVIKPGSTAVLGPGVEGVEQVILARARAVGAPVVRVGGARPDVAWEVTEAPTRPGGTLVLDVRTPRAAYEGLALTAPAYQAPNVAVAVAASEAALGAVLARGALGSALARATFPGRFELVREAPPLVIDGAHNPEAAAVLAAAVAAAFADAPPVALIGVMADKDAGGVVRALAPAVAGFVCTRSHSPRALAPEALADVVRAEGTQLLGVAPDVDSGLALADAAAQTAGAGGVLACGSIYVAGEVRALTLGASGCGAACPDDTVESR